MPLPSTLPDGRQNPEWYKAYYEKNKERKKRVNAEWFRRTYIPTPIVGRRIKPDRIKVNSRCRLSPKAYREMAVSLLLERDGSACTICGLEITPGGESIDHKRQRAHGGGHEASNLRLAHRSCNMKRPRNE